MGGYEFEKPIFFHPKHKLFFIFGEIEEDSIRWLLNLFFAALLQIRYETPI